MGSCDAAQLNLKRSAAGLRSGPTQLPQMSARGDSGRPSSTWGRSIAPALDGLFRTSVCHLVAARPPAVRLLEDCHDGTSRAMSVSRAAPASRQPSLPKTLHVKPFACRAAQQHIRRRAQRRGRFWKSPADRSAKDLFRSLPIPCHSRLANPSWLSTQAPIRQSVAPWRNLDRGPPCPARRLEGDADLLVTIRIDAHSSRGLYKFSAPAGTVLATAKAASRMGWASGRFRTYHPTGTSARLRHPGREA